MAQNLSPPMVGLIAQPATVPPRNNHDHDGVSPQARPEMERYNQICSLADAAVDLHRMFDGLTNPYAFYVGVDSLRRRPI